MYRDGSPWTGGPPGSQGWARYTPARKAEGLRATDSAAGTATRTVACAQGPTASVRATSRRKRIRPGAQTTLAGMSRKDSSGPGNGLQGRGTLCRAAHAALLSGHLFCVAHPFNKPNTNAQPALGVSFLSGSSSGNGLPKLGVRRPGASLGRVTRARVPAPWQMPRGAAARPY